MATAATSDSGLSFGRLLRASATLLSGDVAAQVATILTSAVLVRAVGVTDFGVYALIQTTAGMPRRFLGFRTGEALQRSFAIYGDASRRRLVLTAAMATDLAVNLVSVLLVLALAPTIAGSFGGGQRHVASYYLCSLTGLLGFMTAPFFTVARLALRFRLISVVSAVGSLVILAISALLAAQQTLTVWTYLVLIAGWSIVELTYKLLYVERYCHTRLGFSLFEGSPIRFAIEWRRLADFWKLMVAGYWEESLRGLSDTARSYMLGYFFAPATVGFYRLAQSAMSAVWQISKIMSNVVFMDFSRAVAQARFDELDTVLADVRRIWGKSLLGLALLTLPLVYPAVLLLYGRESLGCVVPTQILLVGCFVSSYWFWGRSLLLALGQLRTFSRLALIVVTIALPVELLATWALGLIGLSIAVALHQVVWNLIFAVHATRILAQRRLQPAAGVRPPSS